MVLLGPRYGYLDSATQVMNQGITVLAHVFMNWHDLGVEGLDLGVGGYNILAQPYTFGQAYSAGHPPMPGLAAEIMLRLHYSMAI